jgi:Aspartyl protease/Zinc knuckle
VTAEHSTINEIVSRARHIEKTLVSIRSGRKPDGQSASGAPGITGMPQRSMRDSRDSRDRNQSTKKPLGRSSGKMRPQTQQSVSKPDQTTNPQPGRGDTSKLTCYKCGQYGHIATNPKGPQYKKPAQRQMFAAQVIDDRSEGDLPDINKPSERSEEANDANPESDTGDQQEEHSDQDDRADTTEGPHLDGDHTSYEEYDGYETPSEDDDSETEYMQAMHEEGILDSIPLPRLEDADWELRRNDIRMRYERAPWVHHDALEFTPQYSVTHIRGCDVCIAFKEHTIITKAIKGENSIAWTARDKFERDLISLGWTMALTESRGRPINALSALNDALETKNHHLSIEVESLRLTGKRAIAKCKDLEETLSLDCLDLDLRCGEIDLLQSHCRQIARYCTELEHRLSLAPSTRHAGEPINGRNIRSLIAQISALPHSDGDIMMQSDTTSEAENLSEIRTDNSNEYVTENAGQIQEPQINGIIDARSGSSSHPVPLYRLTIQHPNNHTDDVHSDEITYERIAAACDDGQSKDREFRSAQRRTYTISERPRSSNSDRRCMATLIKVNDLEAYALLDSGSTTVSITHDFACVARLKVMQLENPIALQLGTVGSRSVINFGSRASLTLGPIRDNDAYLDVVNIDRYDMIIGTPFMRKHGLVMDFSCNELIYRGKTVPTLTAGQEDLMISRRRSSRLRTPAPPEGKISQSEH